jgi:hypothetical protein
MQKSFRTIALAIGAAFLSSSLIAAQAAPSPAPDTAPPAPQHHAKAGKTRKNSSKKGKRARKKKTAKR